MRNVTGTIIVPCFVSQALSLCGCGGHRVAVTFVVWPWWVLSHYVLCHRHCHCVALVGIVSHGCSGHHVVWPQWALRRIAMVGVIAPHFVLRAL